MVYYGYDNARLDEISCLNGRLLMIKVIFGSVFKGFKRGYTRSNGLSLFEYSSLVLGRCHIGVFFEHFREIVWIVKM